MARSAVKREQILDELRQEIVSGTVPRGARLPTRLDLERRFQVSGATIQQALDKLRREGFVVAQGSRGTFVSDNPPHLCQYGLLFPSQIHENRFYTALANAAEKYGRDTDRKFARFHNLDGHADVDDFQRLIQSLKTRRLAGLIFSTPPGLLQGTPAVDMPGIPRVVVRDSDPYDGLATVRLDPAAFLHRAIADLVSRGRRKLAVVRLHSLPETIVVNALQSFGMEVRPHWLHTASLHAPDSLRSLMKLLMHPGQQERPDALVICDDNFEADALGGLAEARVVVPEELDIICHSNHPVISKSPMRIRRLGYDARRILEACVDLIDRQRNGEPPSSIGLQPVFEGEFPRTN